MGQAAFKVEFTVKSKGRGEKPYNVKDDLGGQVTLKEFLVYAQDMLVSVAVQTLKEELDKGFDKDFKTFVDNKPNTPLEAVKPFGRINFVAPISGLDMMEEIWDGLVERSKVVTGEYQKGHTVFFNRTKVASTKAELLKWLNSNPAIKPNDYVEFVNTVPYARKLERLGVTKNYVPGKNSTRQIKSKDKNAEKYGRAAKGKINAPNGVYYITSKAIKRKYKLNANITFTWVSGGNYGQDRKFKSRGVKRDGKGGPRHYVYPAIRILFNKGGAY